MREKGNGEPYVCATNLVNTIKTEVPFNREKGITTMFIDSPALSIEDIDSDITELIEKYEPRINPENVSINIDAESVSIGLDAENGNFDIRVDVSPKTEI